MEVFFFIYRMRVNKSHKPKAHAHNALNSEEMAVASPLRNRNRYYSKLHVARVNDALRPYHLSRLHLIRLAQPDSSFSQRIYVKYMLSNDFV